jgi:hypothetical protein
MHAGFVVGSLMLVPALVRGGQKQIVITWSDRIDPTTLDDSIQRSTGFGRGSSRRCRLSRWNSRASTGQS